jgi:hypothetical protein
LQRQPDEERKGQWREDVFQFHRKSKQPANKPRRKIPLLFEFDGRWRRFLRRFYRWNKSKCYLGMLRSFLKELKLISAKP